MRSDSGLQVRRRVRCTGLLMLWVLVVGQAGAQAPAAESVLDWAKSEWERADHVFDAPGLVFHYSVSMYSEKSAAEVARLATEVGDRPDHPRTPLRPPDAAPDAHPQS